MADKPKYDYLKQMRNTSSNERDYQKSVEYYGLQVKVQPSDKIRLERFCKEETAYYNYLVKGFSSRVRAFPEHVLEFDDNWEKVFGYIAETKFDLKTLVKAPFNVELPVFLEPYRNILLSNLTERRILLCSLAASSGLLIPKVRRNMALEVLRFYKEQANRFSTPAAKSNNDEESDSYKIAPETLELADMSRKRHLQVPKSELVVTYNEQNSSTEIRVSYAAYPIIIHGLNLVKRNNWNYIIIQQEPGQYPTPMTPWVVDIKKTSSPYLIKNMNMRSFNKRR